MKNEVKELLDYISEQVNCTYQQRILKIFDNSASTPWDEDILKDWLQKIKNNLQKFTE
jgi:hypothetical protein